MNRLLFTCAALLCCLFVHAQNISEAKMAYQLAEEKFDAQKYQEALALLEKAEIALGKNNPPMAYLRVMIANQLLLTRGGKVAFNNLEKALVDFEKQKDRNALGEEKLMEVYRIKSDLQKAKVAIQKEEERKIAVKNEYETMIYRLASAFPKTDIKVADFISNLPESWSPLKVSKSPEKTQKLINKIIKNGTVDLRHWDHSGFTKMDGQTNRYQFSNIETYKAGEDRIGKYLVNKVLREHQKERHNKRRTVTVREICNLIKISEQMWVDFTTGAEPLIRTTGGSYLIHYKSPEKGSDGQYKSFSLEVYRYTWNDSRREGIAIQVSKNIN